MLAANVSILDAAPLRTILPTSIASEISLPLLHFFEPRSHGTASTAGNWP